MRCVPPRRRFSYHGHLQRIILDVECLQHVDDEATEVLGTRVVVLVHAMAEAHQPHAVFLGLHLAYELCHLGVTVTVNPPRLLSRQLKEVSRRTMRRLNAQCLKALSRTEPTERLDSRPEASRLTALSGWS
jgi:hypothetical protein